jgi:hypothetical protein
MDADWGLWLTNVLQFGLLPIATALLTQIIAGRQATSRAKFVHRLEKDAHVEATKREVAEKLHMLLSEYNRTLYALIIHRLESSYYSANESSDRDIEAQSEDEKISSNLGDISSHISRIVSFHLGEFRDDIDRLFERVRELHEREKMARSSEPHIPERKVIADILRALATVIEQSAECRVAVETAYGSGPGLQLE